MMVGLPRTRVAVSPSCSLQKASASVRESGLLGNSHSRYLLSAQTAFVSGSAAVADRRQVALSLFLLGARPQILGGYQRGCSFSRALQMHVHAGLTAAWKPLNAPVIRCQPPGAAFLHAAECFTGLAGGAGPCPRHPPQSSDSKAHSTRMGLSQLKSFSRASPLVLQPVSRPVQRSLPVLLLGSLGHHGTWLLTSPPWSSHAPALFLRTPVQAAAHQASLPSGGVSCGAAWQQGRG